MTEERRACKTEGCKGEVNRGGFCDECHRTRNRDAQQRFRDGVIRYHQCKGEGCTEQIPLRCSYCDSCRVKVKRLQNKARSIPVKIEKAPPPPPELKKDHLNPDLLLARMLKGSLVSASQIRG